MKQIARVLSSARPHIAGSWRDPLAAFVEHLRCSSLPGVLLAEVNGGPSAPEMQVLLVFGLVSASGNLSPPTHGITRQGLDCIFVSHQLEWVCSSIIKRDSQT